jgi:5-methylcytosine-specific restriction endonuclease McrA
MREYYATHPEYAESVRQRTRRRRDKYREEEEWNRAWVLAIYGDSCTHCGSAEDLGIDHIVPWTPGRGPRGGDKLRRHLIKNSFPPGFQILCRECNARKGC